MSGSNAVAEEQYFTYADYKAWELKPRERYEIIYGVAYAMSAPNTIHQQISIALASEFFTFLKGKPCKAFHAPYDVRLFYEEDESDDTVVQPDVMVICDPKKIGEEGCRGAPDLVVEILSPSNNVFEMERKLKLYREAGVREYWVVDPKNKHISIYRLKGKDYILQTSSIQDSVQSEILPGLEISLTELFGKE